MKSAMIILWISLFWLPVLEAYMLINETKFKKNIMLGVTFPADARDDTNIAEVTSKFKKQTIIVCVILMALIIPAYMLSNETNFMTLWMIWILLAIILPYLPYVPAHLKLREFKEKMGWKKEDRTILIDTASVPPARWISPVSFALPTALSLLPLVFDREFWAVHLLMALSCLASWLGYRYLYRNKSEMVDRNVTLTRALSNVRKANWGKMWLMIAWFMAITSVAMFVMARSAALGTLIMVVSTVIILIVAFRIEMSTRSVQERLTKDSGGEWYVDDDDKWILGMFYYNPDDASWLVNSRIGVNSTVNIAHPVGKVLTALAVIFLLTMPLYGSLFNSFGRRKIDISISDSAVVAKSGMTTYEISRDDIESIVLTDRLPDGLVRVMGTGMPTLIKGDFTADGMGHINVMADPTVPPYVLIRTTSGKYYLLGSRDSSVTEELYSELDDQF